jgi:putative oxidoreductase
MSCKKIYEGLILAGRAFQHPLLLILRLYWGYSLLQSGWGKLHNIDAVSNYFNSLNIPLPLINAYLASGTEFLGGSLLLIGLAARLAAIPLVFTMLVAFMTAHLPAVKRLFEEPDEFIAQKPFTYLLTCLIIFTFGPGMFSMDALLKRFVFKQK